MFFSGPVFVYDTNIAHPGLTRQAAELYQTQIAETQSGAGALTDHRLLTSEEINWLTRGAIDEDYPFRWMNHFYDPIHNKGFKSSYDTAKGWAKNPANQASFSLGDHSWQRAIYEYQQGNKKEAFLALGHILHLLEDMTVPAHTRDDAHPEGDPYENWARDNFKTVSASPIYFNNLNEYFDYLANYSNNNFYSQDTIWSQRYLKPTETDLAGENDYIYSYDGSNRYKILYVKEDKRLNIKEYRVNNTAVLSDYFSLLAPKAVGAGAGVIKLFFEEAAKEKIAAPTSLQTNIWGGLQQPVGRVVTFMEETMNSVKQIVSQPGSFTGYVNFASDLFGSGVALAKDLNEMPVVGAIASLSPETKLTSRVAQAVLPMAATAAPVNNKDSSENTSLNLASSAGRPSLPLRQAGLLRKEDEANLGFRQDSSILIAPTPKVGVPSDDGRMTERAAPVVSGGSSFSGPASSPTVSPAVSVESILPFVESASSSVKSEPPPPPPDITPPEVPTILTPVSSTLWTKSASTTINGLVSLDTFKLIMNNSEEQTSSSVWSMIVDLNEGENLFEFSAKDLAGNQSATATVKIYKDSTAPKVVVQGIISKEQGTIVEVSWSGGDGAGSGVQNYDVEYKSRPLGSASSTDWFSWQQATTSESATFTGEEGNQYIFRARATDKLGNVGEWVESENQIIGWPRVVINEIAWAGTKAQANDEWMELYNASSTAVDLTGWTLFDDDKNDIRITFATGSIIAARGFYLLERTTSTTISNIKEDAVYTGSLKNSGEKLQLRHRSGQLIDEVDFNVWPAGSVGQDPISMERINPLASGSNAANWQSTPVLVRNGYDAKGDSIYGTPKHPNSSFVYLNGTINTNRNLLAEYNPYFLGALTVASGTVLTAQEGVVMLGGSGSRVNVYGEFKTQGTIEKPVIFTSFNDTNYKGDAVVSAAYWEYIKFFNGAKGDFKNTKLLYGNNASQGVSVSGGILQADGATVMAEGLEIGRSNLTNDYRLVALTNSTTTLSGSKFYQGSAGMYLKGGAVTIKNSQFEDLGLWALEADSLNSLVLEKNTFKNNGWVYPTRPFWQQPSSLPAPAAVKNFIPQAKNNVFDNNIINAMSVAGQINNSGTIDNAGDWPWVSGGLTVTASGTLEIKAGSKLKMLAGSTITVNGALNVFGVDGQPVSITSYHDDSDGSDVDLLNNQPANKEGGEWRQIIFESSATSTLNYLNVSFANGTPRDANSAGSVFVNATPLTLNNLTVRYSRPSSAALQLKNTNATVARSLFKNDVKIPFDPSSAGYGVGIIIDGGAPGISSSIIDTFTYGIIKKNKPLVEPNEINFINVDKETVAW